MMTTRNTNLQYPLFYFHWYLSIQVKRIFFDSYNIESSIYKELYYTGHNNIIL